MSQLRDDLSKRIRERHVQWHKDSIDLYRMAGLKAIHVQQDVFVVLMTQLAGFCHRFDVEPKEIADALAAALDHFDEMEAEQ